MVSGVLAHKEKNERLKPLFFLCSTLSMLDNRPEEIESSMLHILRAVFLLAASVWRGLNELR
jgi:hypothetical protein